MSEGDGAGGEGVAALRRELADKEEELSRALKRLKSADARIHELEAGAGGASPDTQVDEGDPYNAAACRARLVESGKNQIRNIYWPLCSTRACGRWET